MKASPTLSCDRDPPLLRLGDVRATAVLALRAFLSLFPVAFFAIVFSRLHSARTLNSRPHERIEARNQLCVSPEEGGRGTIRTNLPGDYEPIITGVPRSVIE